MRKGFIAVLIRGLFIVLLLVISRAQAQNEPAVRIGLNQNAPRSVLRAADCLHIRAEPHADGEIYAWFWRWIRLPAAR